LRPADFDYELPPGRIAQAPAAVRDRARLFVHERAQDRSHHREVRELGEFLRAGDLLVVNDTRVIPARLFARRASGGRVDLLMLEPDGGGDAHVWQALLHPARRLRPGERLALEGAPALVHLIGRVSGDEGEDGMAWRLALEDEEARALDPLALMAAAGHVPLPPYVERPDGAQDVERYQTVYAAAPGAVAAPTAGLHFTPELLARLAAQGIARASVTLHVGHGTFRPVQSGRVEDHRMHPERFELPEATAAAIRAVRLGGGRVVAVGTTVVRVLESCVDADGAVVARSGSTRLFLFPGAHFRVVDALLTNFHLPRSSLLMLVCAFAGRERVLRLYGEALERGYRFTSYGDAQLFL
jgi:S-adenosylmethionine:tRNA ribosyltransferase-isomerase